MSKFLNVILKGVTLYRTFNNISKGGDLSAHTFLCELDKWHNRADRCEAGERWEKKIVSSVEDRSAAQHVTENLLIVLHQLPLLQYFRLDSDEVLIHLDWAPNKSYI